MKQGLNRDKKPYIRIIINDWRTSPDVLDMTWAERGVYFHLLTYQWDAGSIPADLKRLNKLTGVEKPVLVNFFKKWGHLWPETPEPDEVQGMSGGSTRYRANLKCTKVFNGEGLANGENPIIKDNIKKYNKKPVAGVGVQEKGKDQVNSAAPQELSDTPIEGVAVAEVQRVVAFHKKTNSWWWQKCSPEFLRNNFAKMQATVPAHFSLPAPKKVYDSACPKCSGHGSYTFLPEPDDPGSILLSRACDCWKEAVDIPG